MYISREDGLESDNDLYKWHSPWETIEILAKNFTTVANPTNIRSGHYLGTVINALR
jgi:hypothetical protein